MTPRTENAETTIHAEPPQTRMAARLEPLSGRQFGRSFAVPAAGLILGRQSEPAAPGADPTVSRRHARLYFSDQGQPVIEDLGSVNGTFLNGNPVSAPRSLRDQDVIKIGNTELRFTTLGASSAPAAVPGRTRQPPEATSQLPQNGQHLPPASHTPAAPVQPARQQGAPPGPRDTLEKPRDHAQNLDPPGYAEACARARAGDVTTAVKLLQECHRHDPGHFGTLYGLGMCYRALEDRGQARAWLAAAQAIDPHHPGVAKAVKALDQAPPRPAIQHDPVAQSPGSPPAAPDPKDAVPSPRRKPSLAQDLDSDVPVDADRLPGNLIRRGHRRLLSHKRLYIGAIALLVAIAAAKTNSAASAAYGSPAPLSAALRGSQLASLGLAVCCILGAFLSQALTHYEVYERRVDISRGVLFRKRQMVWLYDVLDIELFQTPILMLSGTGTLIFQLDHQAPSPLLPRRKSSLPQLRAFGSLSQLRDLQKELLAAAEVERRSMKKGWI